MLIAINAWKPFKDVFYDNYIGLENNSDKCFTFWVIE